MEIALREAICEILMREWDPLGVHKIFPSNVDEYDRQAEEIVAMLAEPAFSRERLLKYLDDAAYECSRSWDDKEAMARTADQIGALRVGSG